MNADYQLFVHFPPLMIEIREDDSKSQQGIKFAMNLQK